MVKRIWQETGQCTKFLLLDSRVLGFLFGCLPIQKVAFGFAKGFDLEFQDYRAIAKCGGRAVETLGTQPSRRPCSSEIIWQCSPERNPEFRSYLITEKLLS